MAKDRERSGGGGGGVSFRSKDAVDVGLFSSGHATIKEAVFTPFTYKGQNKPVNLRLVTYTRKGEQPYEQPYGIGKGWKIGKQGELIPTAGQTGLPKTCHATKYLIAPLERALKKASLDPDEYLGETFPGSLEGLDVVVARVDQEKRTFKGRKDDDGDPKTILTIEAIGESGDEEEEEEEADDEKPKGKVKVKAKAKAKDDDDDEDEEEEDADADGDEDEERPKAKAKVTAKGKAKGANDDRMEEDEDDDLLELGIEALIDALEQNDGTLKRSALADALDVALKGNPKRKAILAFMDDDDVLNNEKGWTYNEKKKLLTLDK